VPRGYTRESSQRATVRGSPVEVLGERYVGRVAEAIDLATCDTLWTLTAPVGSFAQVWRVNTTLVQLSDDGTELVSLVAPS
jgi:hypothetical protein